MSGPALVPSAKPAFDGRLFKVQIITVKDRDGREVQREVVRHPGAVVVVPVLDDQTLVMIRNYRVAVDEVLWEFPAGKIEAREEPLAAAHRELQEEAGYRAGAMRKLGEFYTSPGFADELMRAFVAESLTAVGQKLESGEQIEVRTVTVDQALAMAADGRIRDGKTIAALLLWRAHGREAAARIAAREAGP